MKIILASQSPRRRELLGKITTDFEVCVPDVDESLVVDNNPPSLVGTLALQKAQAVAALPQYADCCVIGADTVVAIDGAILGKPADRGEAVAMLEKLSGRTHTVFTGLAVLTPTDKRCAVVATEVDFYPLTDEEIGRYIDSYQPYDKAGGYGIQDGGGLFVSSVSGDYYNVVGLPVAVLYRELMELDVLPKAKKL